MLLFGLPYAAARSTLRHAADAADKRATRSDAPKAKYAQGDKVRVKYPEGTFSGVVRSSTPAKTVIYFAADKTEDTFLPGEYGAIRKR